MIAAFELFSTQTALRTNNTMRALTFVAVVIGCQTVIAGIGMNFEAPFFKSAAVGFWIAVQGGAGWCRGIVRLEAHRLAVGPVRCTGGNTGPGLHAGLTAWKRS